MIYLVVKHFLVWHGLKGKDLSDDQYGNNVLVVAFEIISLMNIPSLVILPSTSPIRVILSSGSFDK